jgi:hypothetical protein
MLESRWRRLICNFQTPPEASGSGELVTSARVSQRIRGSGVEVRRVMRIFHSTTPLQVLPTELRRSIHVELVAQAHGIVIVDQHERLADGERVEPLDDAWVLVNLPYGTDVKVCGH